MVHAREEGLEIGEALVAPVELHAAPEHHAAFLQQRGLFLVREEHVQRGSLLGQLERRRHQRPAPGVVAGQQPAALDRRKGHGA